MKTTIILLCLLLAGFGAVLGTIGKHGVSLTKPPGLMARLRIFTTTNIAETSGNSSFEELRWSELSLDADSARQHLSEACLALGWSIQSTVTNSLENHEIQAVVTSGLLRFRDNLRIEIQQSDGENSKINVRSASEKGKGDFGANLAHIVALRRQFEQMIHQ